MVLKTGGIIHLAAITNDLLKKAGVELGAGESLTIRMGTDDSGAARLLVDVTEERLQKVIDNAVAKDPSILKAFTDEYNSVAVDVESLNGQYDGAGSSVDYVHARREFILSGDDPSAMIMADRVGVKSTGYTYQKKVSDSFDPDADSISTRSRDGGSKFLNAVDEALKNGTTVASTVTKEEFDALPKRVDERLKRARDLMRKLEEQMARGNNNGSPIQESRSSSPVAASAPSPVVEELVVSDKSEAKGENEPSSIPDDVTVTIDDGKNAIRRMSLSTIMEMLTSQRGIFDTNIFNIFRNWN